MSPVDLPPTGLEEPAAAIPAPGFTHGGAPHRAPMPSKPKRKYLTKRERAQMWLDQKGLCGCGCGEKLIAGPRATVAEHTNPVALGNGEKPDHIRNKKCADRKSYGGQDGDKWSPVGGDIRDIAHVKRIAEKRTQHDRRNERGPKLKSNATLKSGRKMQSAGFRKDVRRKMNGTTELVR